MMKDILSALILSIGMKCQYSESDLQSTL